MFARVTGDGEACLRLSAADRQTFAAENGATAVIQHGAVLKDSVALPATLSTDAAGARRARASAHSATLKPKPMAPAKKYMHRGETNSPCAA
jgi:hypothetical protein